ncbi:MAG: hemolysin family protein [Candidatus Binatia bacterium]
MYGRLLHEVEQYWHTIVEFLAVDSAQISEPDMLARLVLQATLLGASAFFASSETALFSLSRLDLQKLRKERHRHSETLHALLDQPRRLIISILCGNELVNVAAAANMTGILASLYGVERAVLMNILVMVPLLLLFAEVTPKTIAVSNPVRVSTAVVAVPLNLWVQFVTPLRWAVRGIADRLTTLVVGETKAAENLLQVDEFRTLVEEVAKKGELNATERALIYNLLEAGDTEIVEIMTPRTRTDFLNAEMPVPELIARFQEYRHTRIPVFREHRDNLVGFIHAEDVLRLVLDTADPSSLTIDDLLRPPVVVPLTKRVDEMLDFFQEHQARAAAVLNEFGGVEGFITITDVLTFIFGEISGDVRGAEFYREQDENIYVVPGEMLLTDFNDLTNFGIEDPRMTTIGGVVFRHLDRLPRVENQVTVEGIVMTVLAMDGHRIARVRVARGVAAEEAVDETMQQEQTNAAGGLAATQKAAETTEDNRPSEHQG